MQFKLNFRVPAKALKAWNGTGYTVDAASTSVSVKAVSEQQAFRIAQSIASKNGWAVSGQPVRV